MTDLRQPGRPDSGGLVRGLHLRFGHAAARVANLLRPQLNLGVRLLALDAEGRVFLVRHSYLPGLHMPGGAVDAGETCRAAAVREAAEEGGLVLDRPPELFHVYCGDGLRDHVVLFVARGARQPRPKRASLEILSAGFYPVEPLPEAVSSGTRARIAEVLRGEPPSDLW